MKPSFRIIIVILMIIVGSALFLDEIGMLGVQELPYIEGELPDHGWLIGNWSALHIEPFHHWMWGVMLMFSGIVILLLRFV
jgi:hypothetical protein